MTATPMQWALKYARAGLAVMPTHWVDNQICSCGAADCASAAKHPLLGHGLTEASTDTDTITTWWTRWPLANVAIRPPQGVIVLDVDPRHGGGTALVELGKKHNGQLAATWSARTGGGGLHAWYRYGGPMRGKLCTGVDLKGANGYLLAEPSSHISGGQYSWITNLPVAPLPAWLRRLLAPAPVPAPRIASADESSDAAAASLVRTVAAAQEGGRNAALHWAACRCIERGADPTLLADIEAAALSVGLGELEIRRTISSARRTVGGTA